MLIFNISLISAVGLTRNILCNIQKKPDSTITTKAAETCVVSAVLARQKGFEPPTPSLGGLTYPLEGVCNIRFLHKIRIFRGLRGKIKLFSVTSADFTASPDRVAPRRVPKMAPFIQNRTKLLFKRRVSRVFFCFYDRNKNKSDFQNVRSKANLFSKLY